MSGPYHGQHNKRFHRPAAARLLVRLSDCEILRQLKSKASPTNLKGMARFGMTVEKRFGVSVPDMRGIAKDTGKDHKLAAKLWKTGIAEAKIVASMIAVPEQMSANDMDSWVLGFDS